MHVADTPTLFREIEKNNTKVNILDFKPFCSRSIT